MDFYDFFGIAVLLGAALHWFNHQGRSRRTAVLAEKLRPFQIERLMQQITEGSMRALGETDPQRQVQVWQLQQEVQQQLVRQFQDFAQAFAQLSAPQARTLKVMVPGVEKVLPQATFDARRVMQVHADGLARAVANKAGRSLRDQAYVLMAEMFLMQHSCHWFCRGKTIASARMLAQHKTHYEQALNAVDASTRTAYLAVIQGPALG